MRMEKSQTRRHAGLTCSVFKWEYLECIYQENWSNPNSARYIYFNFKHSCSGKDGVHAKTNGEVDQDEQR